MSNQFLFKIRLVALFLLMLSVFFPVIAQVKETKTITGTVKNELGEELPGVLVSVKSQQRNTVTDKGGRFKFEVHKNVNTLSFSMLGMQTQEVNIREKAFIQITMYNADHAQLDEVVVIGYGTSRKSDLTGSVSTVKASETDKQQFTSVDGLLKGRAAGVQVVQSSGDPGGTMSVKIRGVNSLRGDNEPLYVVDGVIIDNISSDAGDPFSQKTANSGQGSQSGLSGINPQDIESIEILKDASATAIYGSRGANGVVIITTKQGKGKAKIAFSTNIQISEASKKLRMLDAVGYANYRNDLEELNGRQPAFGLDTLVNVNWQNELEQRAFNQNHRLSLTGSSEDGKTKYFLAGGYLKNTGIIKRSGVDQGDLKLNFEQRILPKLNLNLTISGNMLKNNMSMSTEPLGSGDNSMIMKMLIGSPILNAQAPLDGSDAYDNPLSWLAGYDDLAEEKRLISGLGVSYQFSKRFSYKMNFATDYRAKERVRWYGKQTFQGKNANGSLGLSTYQKQFYQIESLFNYKHTLKQGSRLDATLGVTYDNSDIRNSSVINENFFTEELRAEGFGFGQVLYPYVRFRSGAEVFSTLGRVNYNLLDKYLFTLSGRADGSSKFAKGNKFSFFPAAAFAWKINNEKFLKAVSAINELKLRLGYGRSGNQAIDPYSTFARYGQSFYVNGNTLISASSPLNIQNELLKWETTQQVNAGLDASLFANRLTFTIDTYLKNTRDLLQTFKLAPSSGYDAIVKNIGSIQNKGLEISVTGVPLQSKDLKLTISGNMGINRNKITDLGLPSSDFGIHHWEAYIGPNVSNGTYFKDPANIFVVGMPIGMFYGYKTDGVYQISDQLSGLTQFGNPVKHGDVKMVDQNSDGNIDANDKVIIGNPNPDFTYGFSTSLTYKNWNFDLFFNGSYGNDIANGNLFRLGNPSGNNFGNILASTYEEAWTTDKPSSSPRVGYDNISFIDRYVEDGSYLRLSTVTLGYNFPLKSQHFIRNLGVSLIANNLFTITNYTGFDPEVNSFSFNSGKVGVDWSSYPNLRGFSASVRLTF